MELFVPHSCSVFLIELPFFLQRNITFSESLTQVFEYPSSESTSIEEDAKTKAGITTNKNPIGSFGKSRLYLLDAVGSSGILKAKQKLGRTFNSNKLGGIAFTKISKLTMCSA